MKGIEKSVNQCPKCNGEFSDSEYDTEQDICLYCLFPEAGKHQPTEFEYKSGYAKNNPQERKVLDELEYIPSKIRDVNFNHEDKAILRKISPKKRKLYK